MARSGAARTPRGGEAQKIAKQRRLPPTETLLDWKRAGLTHQQIVERVERETGVRLSRSSVSVALGRANVREPQARYDDLIPWRVKAEHAHHYAAEMLRLEARRRRGLPLSQDRAKKLDAWVKQLKAANAVVTYLPWTSDGFHYIFREATDKRGALIRVPEREAKVNGTAKPSRRKVSG